MSLNTNITNLQEILDKVNNLPNSEPQESLEEELNAQSILLEEQNAKITELAEALANKAGNKNIKYDTCSVAITLASGSLFGYCMTCFDGEKVVQRYDFSTNNLGSIAITDVICGSTISIISSVNSGYSAFNDLIEVGSISSKGSILIAPTQPGAYAQIRIGGASGGGSDD